MAHRHEKIRGPEPWLESSPSWFDRPFVMDQRTKKSGPVKCHTHRGLEIGTPVRGKAVFHAGGSTYEIGEGQVYFIDGMVPHGHAGVPGSESFENLYVHLSTAAITTITSHDDRMNLFMPFARTAIGQPPVIDNPQIAGMLVHALTVFREPCAMAHFNAWCEMIKVLTALAVATEIKQAGETADIHTAHHGIVAHVMDALAKDFDRDVRIETLASQCGVSVSHLQHVFARHTGRSIIDYRNGLRLNAAIEHLASSALTIEAIAERCGFNTLSQFYSLFKRFTGSTPSAYRRSQQNRGGRQQIRE